VQKRFTDEDLVILVPMLGRAETIERLMVSINNTVPKARTLFIVSSGDHEVIKTLKEQDLEYIVTFQARVGDYAKKINLGYNLTKEPLIFTGASDIFFRMGWFEAAVAKFNDPNVHVVGTNDLANPRVIQGLHSTHTLVTREYVKKNGLVDGEPDKILYEGYVHEFVDDEMVATAKLRGAWAFCKEAIVEHFHPSAGKAKWDDSYKLAQERMDTSLPLFSVRSALWGGQRDD